MKSMLRHSAALGFAWMLGCTNASGPAPAVSTTPAPAISTNAAPPINPAPAVAESPASAVEPIAAAEPEPAAQQTPAETASTRDTTKPRPILGKKTSDIRDAKKEEAKGAQRASTRITGQDPITLTGNAYISIVGHTEVLNMRHTLDLYYALNGRYPKDLDEFMKEIVKKSGVRLAQLPYYQEYAYDAVKHELVILEYPDRKPGGK